MKRLPPAKRNQLIGVVAATVGVICMVYFMLISPQNAKNRDLAMNISKESARLTDYRAAGLLITNTFNTLTELNEQLDVAEQDVASGDLYAWTVEMMRRFKTPYAKTVDIPNVGQPTTPQDCDLIGGFPYKQIRFTLTGTAHYHDLGKFISEFENRFVHCRVVNLSLEPNLGSGGPPEKLNFRMEIVALVRPNS